MRLLFVKHRLEWPRASGHDVHTFNMMKACAELGHEVAFAAVEPVRVEALAGAPIQRLEPLGMNGTPVPGVSLQYGRLQERFRSYWGVDRSRVARLRLHAESFHPDAAILAGLDALAYLPGIPAGTLRIWYAADEWVRHHLSLIEPRSPASWATQVRAALLKGVYERAYASLVDRAWVVSEEERRAMRWLAGVRQVDVVPNGVDATHYRPADVVEIPRSAVFWGRLDFEPNVQALIWFCREIWPAVRMAAPDARFTIIGFQPQPDVVALQEIPGISVQPDLPDLRDEVGRHAVVVLPFVSGGGIKNKLLEAAAMGKPIVCTPRAGGGLRQAGAAALVVAHQRDEWVRELTRLWDDAPVRRRIGEASRAWVVAHHSWRAAALEALAGIATGREARR